MTYTQLVEQIKKKKTFLCIGLDTDVNKIPKHLLETDDPVFEFNKQIIDATKDLCVAYKPNLAFYEVTGAKGLKSLKKTIDYIPKEIFTIADAKRGDIGNTSGMYAKTFFEYYNADAVTVAPYMGSDSVKPFLNYPDKWAIILALTSNEGAVDFQFSENKSNEKLFETVLKKTMQWGTKENTMYVVGATKAEMLRDVRKIIPEHFLLVPGIGAQGGSLEEVCNYGMNDNIGLLVNSSRQIIYASAEKYFAEKAREEAMKLQKEMEVFL
jgi:orotidine-5'-phosphate decarboxylase